MDKLSHRQSPSWYVVASWRLGASRPFDREFRMKTLMVLAATSALLISGCGGGEASGEPIAAPNFQKILSRLQDWDLKLAELGEVWMPRYSVNPSVLLVGGGTLEAYEYGDQSSAAVAIGRISPGYYAAQVVATGLTKEASSPHFYRGDRLLVIYWGTDARVVEALDGAMGKEFADGTAAINCSG